MNKFTAITSAVLFSLQINAEINTKKMDSLLSGVFDENGPGGVALVVKGGKTLYRKAFGMANLELGVKLTPDFIFRVGSVTKQFTAAAIIQLAEKGKIDLTADIRDYLEDYPTDDQKISIENLLTHTSGVNSFTSIKEWTSHKKMQDLSSSELIDFFKDQPMTMAPGEKYEYSNSNYVLLGRIIELVSGKSYSQYLQENIFKPLKMANTSYDSNTRIIKSRAYGYAKRGDEYQNADYISTTQPFASGAIISTVDDLAKWQNGLFNEEVMSKESLAKASKPFVLNNDKFAGYGYSWGYNGYNIQGHPMISYGGATTGYLASTLYLPKEDIYVVVLTNCRCNNIHVVADQLAALSLGVNYEKEAIAVDEELLKSYQGVYDSKEDGERFITYENNTLKYFSAGGRKFTILPFAKDRFYFKEKQRVLHELSFVKDEEGSYKSIIMASTKADVLRAKTDEQVENYAAIEVSKNKLKSYIGKYELAPNFYLNIFIENNKLYAQATNQDVDTLRAYAEDKFVSEKSDIQITFNFDKSNTVYSITVHQIIDHHAKKVE